MLFCLLFILEGMTVRAEESFYEGRLLFTPYGCSSNGIRPPKVTFGEGPDARQPLLLWPDTVQRGARCRVNSNEGSTEVTAAVEMPEEDGEENGEEKKEEQYYPVSTGDENIIFVPLILFLLSGIVLLAEGIKQKE